MKMAIRKNIHNLSQGLPNQEKVQKGDFLKKPPRELIFFKVPMNPWKSKLEAAKGQLNSE